MEIHPLPVKQITLRQGKLYALNTMDDDLVDEFSEFAIGSVTKIFTALTVILLHQQKLLDINDQVSKYIKPTKYDDWSLITIRDLLNHEAGLKGMPNGYVPMKYKTATQVFKKYSKEKFMVMEVGQHRYANWGYVILGHIIEVVTGEPYTRAYRKLITEPLGMSQTGVGDENMSLYDKDKELTAEQGLKKYFACSAGGLHSTISDLQTFALGLWSLLDDETLEIFKDLYFISMIKDDIVLNHKGRIIGGIAEFLAGYSLETMRIAKLKIVMTTGFY